MHYITNNSILIRLLALKSSNIGSYVFICISFSNEEALMKAFEMYDKNGDKVISKEEAKQLCIVFGESTIANLDTDGNGEITFEEFKAMYGIKDHMGIA